MVPRGHGLPVLAVKRGAQFLEARSGATCSPVRWQPVGGVAAWLRELPAPRPATPVGEVALHAGAWTFVRVHRLALSVARVSEGAPAGVAVGGRLVAVNGRASARGAGPGTSVAKAGSLGVQVVVGGDEAAALSRLEDHLAAAYGAVERMRGGFLIRGGPAGDAANGLGVLAQLRARLWQVTGLTVKVVSGPDPRSVAAAARHMPGNCVAVLPSSAASVWPAVRVTERVRPGGTRSRWDGQALVDVESVVSLAQALVGAGSARDRDVGLTFWTDRGRLAAELTLPANAGRTEVHSRVENAVRQSLGFGASVWAVAVSALGPARADVAVPSRQVSLWA